MKANAICKSHNKMTRPSHLGLLCGPMEELGVRKNSYNEIPTKAHLLVFHTLQR